MNIVGKLEALRKEAISIIDRIITEKGEVNFPYYYEDSCDDDINDGDFVWDELPDLVYFDDYDYTVYKVIKVFKNGSEIVVEAVNNDSEYYTEFVEYIQTEDLINLTKFLEDYAKI